MQRLGLFVPVCLGILLWGFSSPRLQGEPGGRPGGLVARADPPAAEKPDEAPEQPPEKFALVLDTGGHTGEVSALAFTPDGRELMSAAHDGTVRFWDLETGETSQVLRPPLRGIGNAALSPDGRLVAVSGGTAGGKEWLILLLSRQDDRVRTFHDQVVQGLAFSPDGKWLASAGRLSAAAQPAPGKQDGVRLWNLERGGEAVIPKDTEGVSKAAAFSPDGTKLVTGTEPGGECWIWSVPADRRLQRLQRVEGLTKMVGSVAWSPDGTQVATASPDGVRLWDVPKKKSRVVSEGGSYRVWFSGNGKKLLYLPLREGTDHAARVYDLDAGRERLFHGHTRTVTAGALSPDGKWAATAGGSGNEIYVWSTAAPDREPRRLGGLARVHPAVGVAPDGKAIAWGDQQADPDKAFQAQAPLDSFFTPERLAPGSLANPPRGAVKPAEYRRAELSSGGLTLERRGNLHRTLAVTRGRETVLTRRFSWPVRCATLVPVNREGAAAATWVAVGTDRQLFLLDAATGEDVCRPRGHQGGVLALAVSRDGRYLVSSGSDQTLRVWNLKEVKPAKEPEDLRPILSLFVAGRDWIAWTSEGYFAASPNGEHLMGWQVDNGPDRLASFHAAEQFRKALYRPDVIKRLLDVGDLKRVLGKRGIEATEVLPPTVTITEPARAVILDKPALTVRATAESAEDNRVTGLQLLVDGRPFADAAPQLTKAPGGRVEAVWQLEPPAGRHRVSVLAQSAKGSQGYSADLWVTNVAPPPPPRLFFLAIGIDKYQKVPKLDCAVNDARALQEKIEAQARVQPALFGAVETRLLPDEKATREGILKSLDWLVTSAKPEDEVLIFYAGHGDRGERGEFQLLTAAYDPKRPEETAVSGKELKEKLTGLRARRVLVLLDACHSGTIALGANDALAGELKQRDCGVAVLCAAAGDEYSLESAQDGHGFFTKELLDGLGGAARNDEGEITLARLYVHVEEKVPRDTRDLQHPVLVGLAAIRSFALARMPRPEGR
jgi:WD40 repeat protein